MLVHWHCIRCKLFSPLFLLCFWGCATCEVSASKPWEYWNGLIKSCKGIGVEGVGRCTNAIGVSPLVYNDGIIWLLVSLTYCDFGWSMLLVIGLLTFRRVAQRTTTFRSPILCNKARKLHNTTFQVPFREIPLIQKWCQSLHMHTSKIYCKGLWGDSLSLYYIKPFKFATTNGYTS